MSTFLTKPYSQLQSQDAVTGKFMFTDCADKDAFYRLRVSNPQTLFEGYTIYDSNMVMFDNDLTTEASITGPTNAAMILSVNAGTNSNAYAARQTHFYAHYQPGKSFLAMFTFSFGTFTPGILKRVGFYDVDNFNSNNPLNGVLFEQTDTGVLRWMVYKGDGTSQVANQTNWNVDPLNGTGQSGYTLDPTKNLLGFVDLEWLGVGRVRTGFFINGVPIICNTFNNSSFDTPYINNPLLPVRYEIRKTIPSVSGSMSAVCCTIISEGGQEMLGMVRTLCFPTITSSPSTFKLSGSEVKSILALRLQNTFPRGLLIPSSLEVVATIGGNSIAYYQVYIWRPSNSTIPSGAVWTPLTNGSITEYTGTDLYPQMLADMTGIKICIDQGSVVSKTKTSFQVIQKSLAYIQSNVDRSNLDIMLIVIDNNNVGNNRPYNVITTWKELDI